jgi:hypothetical protein
MVEFYDDTTGWAGGFSLDSLIEGIWKWIGIPVNTNPVITSIPSTNVIVNDAYVYNITATDPAFLPLTITADSIPAWLSFSQLTDTTALLSGTPDSVHIGMHYVIISASNGAQSVSQPFTIEVLTDKPFFTSTPSTAFIYVGDTVDYLATADDYNGTTLTFGYSELPSFTSITDNGNNTALVYGIADSAGYKHFDIWVSDGTYTVHQTWILLVKPSSGVDQLSYEKTLQIFPNPASHLLNFKTYYGDGIKNISIYNITGELIVKAENINKPSYSIEVSELGSGIYILEIIIGDQAIKTKVAIE